MTGLGAVCRVSAVHVLFIRLEILRGVKGRFLSADLDVFSY